jgi:hypothetical protein
MVSESWCWKEPLLETAELLKTLKSFTELNDEQLVQLEKDIFVGFFSIRKLFETETKVADATKKVKMKLSWHPAVGEKATWRNNHKLDELYDFSKENTEIRDARFVCNKIIHSYIFNLLFNEIGSIEAILFTSDSDKDKRLYSLNINDIVELFELVGNDYPKEIRWLRHPVTGQEITIVK